MLFLMISLFFLGSSATDIYISSLPKMVEVFHSTATIVNLTLSANLFGVAVAALFVGEFSNKYGRRPTLLWGIFCFCFSSLLIGLIPNIWVIIVLRVVQAVGCAVIFVIPRLIFKDYMDEKEQINANGFLLMGVMISPALAPVIGAYLDVYFGWESCFWFSAIFGLVLLKIAYNIVPETLDTKMVKFHPVSHYLHIYNVLFQNRIFLVLTTMYSAGIGAFFAFIGISSYLYINYWHMTPEQYSSLYIWLAVAYFIGNQIMRRLNNKGYSAGRIIQIGTYSTMLGCLIMLLALFIHILFIKIIVVTVAVLFMRGANALSNPPSQVLIMKHCGGHSALALGLNMGISSVVMGLGVSLVTIFDLHPYYGLVIVSSFFVAISVITYALNRRIFSLDN